MSEDDVWKDYASIKSNKKSGPQPIAGEGSNTQVFKDGELDKRLPLEQYVAKEASETRLIQRDTEAQTKPITPPGQKPHDMPEEPEGPKSNWKKWLWGILPIILIAGTFLVMNDDEGKEKENTDHGEDWKTSMGFQDMHGCSDPDGPWGWSTYYDAQGNQITPTDDQWRNGSTLFFNGPPSVSDGRSLTKGEYRLASMFGEDLDLRKIRVHAGPDNGCIAGSAWPGNTSDIAMYGPQYQSLDYSQNTNDAAFDTFYHEVLHLWQSATLMANTNGHCPGVYEYTLTDESQFSDFCVEQQGAIVGDYVMRFLTKNIAQARRGEDTPEYDALLMNVVEGQFPIATELRETPQVDTKNIIESALSNAGEKRGAPTYFCNSLETAFSKVNDFANAIEIKEWGNLKATLEDSVQPQCVVSVGEHEIVSVVANDFNKLGAIKAEPLGALTTKLAQNTQWDAHEEINNNLSAIFHQDQEEKTLKMLAEIVESKESAEYLLSYMRKQSEQDPSLSNNMRRKYIELSEHIRQRLNSLPNEADLDPKQATFNGNKFSI